MATALDSAELGEHVSRAADKAVFGAFLGLFVDFYDIYLPVVALAPALVYFQPKHLPVAVATTIFYISFAVTLLGRPVGAIFFGHFSDKIGRKATTMVAVGGFGVVTLMIAALPGYETWGYLSLGLFIFLRLVDGFFLGGEYTSANPLAMEACPKRKRAIYGAAIQCALPIAYLTISFFSAIMLALVPSAGLHSPYVQWGWRIPFVIGFLLSLLFLLYYRTVPESTKWQTAARSTSPLRDLMKGKNLRTLFQVFVLMTGLWFSAEAVVGVLSGLLIHVLHIPSQAVTIGLLLSFAISIPAYLGVGLLGQKLGRRPVLILAGIVGVAAVPLCYYGLVAIATASHAILPVLALATALIILSQSPWAMLPAYLNERFPTSVRSSGYGIGYSLAIVVPAFYSFYMLGLAKWMPYAYTPVVLVLVGGILLTLGAIISPETREVEL